MIVGWRVAGHMRTPMVLDAIEMARWNRGLHHRGLRCHSDAGSQFTSIRYGERLAEIGAVPSIGTVGDSYDNALAETVNGYYKAELIRGPARQGPWKTIEEVELATLGWVHWHNTQRLHGYLGDLPPAEFEALHAARQDPDPGVPAGPPSPLASPQNASHSFTSTRSAVRSTRVASRRLRDPLPHPDRQRCLLHGRRTGQGSRHERLPLPADVGDALAGWLERGRPRRDSPFVSRACVRRISA